MHTIFPGNYLLITCFGFFWVQESRSVMDSAEGNFKKVVPDDVSEKAHNDDNSSECSDSNETSFTSRKKDKESGSTSDSDEENETSDKAEAAVVQMLKEEEDREKEDDNLDYSNACGTSTTEEASRTEGEDFKVLQHKCDSPGEELLLAYAHVCSFYCSVLPVGSYLIN